MNHDDFEQKLGRQPLRQVPAEWREEILSAASKVGTAHRAVRFFGRAGRTSLPDWLERILWPSPAAWAGLVAVWILIFAVNLSTRDTSPAIAKKNSPPSSEVIVELRQQQQLLAELIGSRETHVTGPLKIFGRQPRSERRFEIMAM
jgi:hypothetical protein